MHDNIMMENLFMCSLFRYKPSKHDNENKAFCCRFLCRLVEIT